MHSTRCGNIVFVHNGDYSGSVRIVKEKRDNPLMIPSDEEDAPGQLSIPTQAIFDFVANKIRMDRIAKLERMDADELLAS